MHRNETHRHSFSQRWSFLVPLLGAALVALSAQSAAAADIYVSPAGVDPVGCVATPNDGVGPNPSPYLTIQKAINCASNGDIIHVAAGTYTENLTLGKTVTMLGAQAGVDGRGARGAESILVPAAPAVRTLTLIVGSAGAVIDGFQFNGGLRAIESTSGPINNLVIRNNVASGFTGGIVFLNDPGIDVTVTRNRFDGTGGVGAGDVVHLDTDGFNGFWLTDNDVVNGGPKSGFFVDGNRNVGASINRAPLISGNKFDGCSVGMNLGTRAMQDGTISLNLFTNSAFDGVQGGPKNVLITKNRFIGNLRNGLALTSFGNTAIDRGAQICMVTENAFSGNGTLASSADVSFSGTQAAGTISTNHLNRNSLGSANAIFHNQNVGGPEIIDCSNNWYGSATGPTVAIHPSGTGGTFQGTGAANLDFTPWLNTATDVGGNPADGFQADRSFLNVDDDSPQFGPTGRVQEGVNSVTASTVNILPGIYVEQVIVNNGLNVVLNGAGRALTFLRAPASLATTFTTSGPNKPVVHAQGAADIRVQNLTVDGQGLGNANNRIVGVGYWNAGGKVIDCDIKAIRNTPLDGAQAGVGILAANNTAGPYALEVGGTNVTDFQKNGMALTGAGLAVNVHNCVVTGAGDVNFIAQNGIQIGPNGGGSVSSTAISNLRYTPATTVASGLLVFQPSAAVNASALNGPNAIANVQAPVSWYDGNGTMDGIEVSGPMTSGVDFGPIFVANFTTLLAAHARPAAMRSVSRPLVSPADGGGSEASERVAHTESASSFNVSVTNSCLNGSDVAGTVGIYAYTGGSPLSVTSANNNLTDWDVALYADGAAASLTANDNSITSNFTAGYDNSASGSPQNAEDNWWGSATGPGGAGPGSGDAVLPLVASNVDFDPWRISGVDQSPACGFQVGPDNPVTPGPAPGCISTNTSCVTVPVSISRTSSTPLRAYSVTLQLSANLQLCTVTPPSITSAGFLVNPNFQVIDNGGGSYTVDEATLGLPCGNTSSGTIFNVQVKSTSPTGTGTITVTTVLLRDCNNVPIASSIGPPASVTIDQAVPAAVVVSAAQKLTGNLPPGSSTTDINLTWTGQEPGASVAVYRKGFGGYPQYDENGGVVPTQPATPGAAAGSGWTLTTVTSTPGVDRTGARDFYYFVAFQTDACGNVSGPSTLTAGTLNYHLGDVHNGVTNCAGNDLVNTSDISFLGANYGTLVPINGALECIDVGPSTTNFVNGRPTTDNRIQFEDLVLFAINYGQVSAPQTRAVPVNDGPRAIANRLRLTVPASLPAVGATFIVKLEFESAGDIQAISTMLGYDAAKVEPIGVGPGELLSRQPIPAAVFSSEPGNVDVARLGTGATLDGAGTLAEVRFRVKASGDPAIVVREVLARDTENHPVALDAPHADGSSTLTHRTGLAMSRPSPFRESTTLEYTLATAGPVQLAIYGIDGRRIRTLVGGTSEPGMFRVGWDGRDESGHPAAAGMYYARLTTAEGKFTRTLVRLN